jgi:hypothetical protein
LHFIEINKIRERGMEIRNALEIKTKQKINIGLVGWWMVKNMWIVG